MESILNELKVNCDDCDADEQGTLSDTNEVTIMYYGSACNCSKRSTCSNAACCCQKKWAKMQLVVSQWTKAIV